MTITTGASQARTAGGFALLICDSSGGTRGSQQSALGRVLPAVSPAGPHGLGCLSNFSASLYRIRRRVVGCLSPISPAGGVLLSSN